MSHVWQVPWLSPDLMVLRVILACGFLSAETPGGDSWLPGAGGDPPGRASGSVPLPGAVWDRSSPASPLPFQAWSPAASALLVELVSSDSPVETRPHLLHSYL